MHGDNHANKRPSAQHTNANVFQNEVYIIYQWKHTHDNATSIHKKHLFILHRHYKFNLRITKDDKGCSKDSVTVQNQLFRLFQWNAFNISTNTVRTLFKYTIHVVNLVLLSDWSSWYLQVQFESSDINVSFSKIGEFNPDEKIPYGDIKYNVWSLLHKKTKRERKKKKKEREREREWRAREPGWCSEYRCPERCGWLLHWLNTDSTFRRPNKPKEVH